MRRYWKSTMLVARISTFPCGGQDEKGSRITVSRVHFRLNKSRLESTDDLMIRSCWALRRVISFEWIYRCVEYLPASIMKLKSAIRRSSRYEQHREVKTEPFIRNLIFHIVFIVFSRFTCLAFIVIYAASHISFTAQHFNFLRSRFLSSAETENLVWQNVERNWKIWNFTATHRSNPQACMSS